MSFNSAPSRWHQPRLYVRIWLAVVCAVAVLSLLVGWAWQLATEPPPREIIVSDINGVVLGQGALSPHPRRYKMHGKNNPANPHNSPWQQPPRGYANKNSGTGFNAKTNANADNTNDDAPENPRNAEYVAQMQDGKTLNIRLRHSAAPVWLRPPFGFFWMLGLVAVAVALATYPIIRKLTRRLEQLQQGVEKWGDGDLSVRFKETGADEVAFLASRFNHAAERIETLINSHQRLLANASHELRSPLTRIRMGIELMGSQPSALFKAEIARNIAELDQLIDEILLASRLNAGEVDMGTIESIDLLGLTAEECARMGAELNLQNPSQNLQEIQGVAKLLRRAIRNLLENARRYSDAEIEVTLAQTATHIQLSVCDRGPGVPVAQRTRIFEPFYRQPGASEHDGGVGLGLALVKSITERHGGQVSCTDRAGGGGACFVMLLPLPSNA